MKEETASVLKTLGIKEMNAGATSGSSAGWLDTKGPELISYSPIDGQPIAGVKTAQRKDYETIMDRAVSAFERFKMMPAPQRGQMVREIGNALREKKRP